ncbi:MAG: hypothetical protein ISS26_00290 [Candidatus Omnitrophica bacterium]|nr:hypothetical protein [Candidatus Omnitrophota bacterium]
MAEDKVVQEGKIFAVIGYLGILCLIPLLFKKENKFALFHGKQGLVIFIGEVALGIISVVPFLGWLVGFFGVLIFGILSLVGIVQVLMGNYWRVPLVADLADKFNI